MHIPGQPYEVSIIGADGNPVKEKANGQVALAQRENYKIRLTNNNTTDDIAATITVDGDEIGQFALGAGKSWDIERHAKIAKLLTFIALGTDDAVAAKLDKVSPDKLGLITVKIVPGKIKRAPFVINMMPDFGSRDDFKGGVPQFRLKGGSRFGAGGTGLSGSSSQQFNQVDFDGDEAKAVTLNLRLIHDPKREIKAGVEPLPGRADTSSPVPPTANPSASDPRRAAKEQPHR